MKAPIGDELVILLIVVREGACLVVAYQGGVDPCHQVGASSYREVASCRVEACQGAFLEEACQGASCQVAYQACLVGPCLVVASRVVACLDEGDPCPLVEDLQVSCLAAFLVAAFLEDQAFLGRKALQACQADLEQAACQGEVDQASGAAAVELLATEDEGASFLAQDLRLREQDQLIPLGLGLVQPLVILCLRVNLYLRPPQLLGF